mmetsp:Transcript_63884/g.103279  ORF Transcript_63884/g.103279 Transcript_63884/m.103279 type:complete len:150 (+) Transcript_63884:169-618(+)
MRQMQATPGKKHLVGGYVSREQLVFGVVLLVIAAVLYEDFLVSQPPRTGSPPNHAGVQGRGCPSACDNGRRLDNSVCPHMSSEGIEAVLDLLDGNSEVWEWGEGSSAVYFSQCVKEWNIIVSDPEHCRDIQDLSTPNMKELGLSAADGG